MTLCKEVCQQCAFECFNVNWNPFDDQRWDKGFVWCYRDSGFTSIITWTDGPPPESCRFRLEHLMAHEDSIPQCVEGDVAC
jgi:hypothetical protein